MCIRDRLNNSAKAVFHVGGDCVGKNILALSRSLSLQHAVQRAEEGKPSEATMEMDGRVYQLLANPVRSPGETVTGVVLLVLDITERSNAEKMRREFTANVSHELKTPRTSISGYAEIMKDVYKRQYAHCPGYRGAGAAGNPNLAV